MLPVGFFGKSIKAQLVGLIFVLTALSIFVVSILGIFSVIETGGKDQKITSDAMQKRVEEFLVENTKAAAEKNSLVFNNIQLESNKITKFTDNIFDNPEKFSSSGWIFDQRVTRQSNGKLINSDKDPSSVFIPEQLTVTPAMKHEYELTSYLDYLFPGILANEPNAAAVYFIGMQGETRYYPNISLANVVPVNYTPAGDVFFEPATPKKDPKKIMQWSVLYDDPAGNGLMITAANPVYTKNGAWVGLVGIDVTLNKISKNIEDYTPIESSYAFLIDKGGRAIALPEQAYLDILGRKAKKGEFGIDLRSVKGDFGTVFAEMRAGKNGFSKVKTKNNNELYVAYSPVKGTNFSLGIAAKQSVLLQVVNDLQNQAIRSTNEMLYLRILPFVFVLLGIVWFYGFTYIKRFTNPLKQLTEAGSSIAAGNLKNVLPQFKTENEIEVLASTLEAMRGRLASSSIELEKLVEERTKELEKRTQEYEDAKKLAEEKLAETEKVNKIMVDREIKMIELKNEVSKLKNESPTDNNSGEVIDKESKR